MFDLSKSKKTRSPTFWIKSSREPATTPEGAVDAPVLPLPAPAVEPAFSGFSLQAASNRTAAASTLNNRRFILLTPSQETSECARHDGTDDVARRGAR